MFLYAYFIYMIKLLDTKVSSCFLSFPSSLRTMIYWIIHATPNTIYNSSAKAEPTACSYSIYQDQIFLKNITIWPWPNFDPWPLCPSPPWPLSGCRPVAVATMSGCRPGTRQSSLPCVSSRRVGYGAPRSVWVGPRAEVGAVLSPGTGPEQNQKYLRNSKLSLGQWE